MVSGFTIHTQCFGSRKQKIDVKSRRSIWLPLFSPLWRTFVLPIFQEGLHRRHDPGANLRSVGLRKIRTKVRVFYSIHLLQAPHISPSHAVDYRRRATSCEHELRVHRWSHEDAIKMVTKKKAMRQIPKFLFDSSIANTTTSSPNSSLSARASSPPDILLGRSKSSRQTIDEFLIFW